MENSLMLMTFFGLLFGLGLGALAVWLALRTRISHEYDRARAEGATHLATLTERLAGKEHELKKLQQAFDKEFAEHEIVRNENTQLKAALEGERRASLER